MTITLRPQRVVRMRPFNRFVLLSFAASFVLAAAVLPMIPDTRSVAVWVAAASLYLLGLAASMLISAWRQRIEVDAAGMTVVPAFGRRRTVTRETIVGSRLRTGRAWDMTGYRYLDLFGRDSSETPLLSIVLDVYSRADQDYILDLAGKITGRRPR